MTTAHSTLHIFGIPKDTKLSDFQAHFASIGKLATDPKTNESLVHLFLNTDGTAKGEAFVTYEDSEAAQSAIELLNGKSVRFFMFCFLFGECNIKILITFIYHLHEYSFYIFI